MTKDTMPLITDLLYKPLLFCSILLFLQINAQKTEDIEGVTLQGKQKKHQNKKVNTAYKIMQEVWKRKHLNHLDQYSTNSYNADEKRQNRPEKKFIKKLTARKRPDFRTIRLYPLRQKISIKKCVIRLSPSEG